MQRFELIEGASSKFWEIGVEEGALTVCYGRIGTAGQTKTKTYADHAAAIKERDKLIKEKTGKGYTAAAAPDAPPGTAAKTPPYPQTSPTPADHPPPESTLRWPTEGFQWRPQWRKELPMVRGINAPPLSADPPLDLSKVYALDDDKLGYRAIQLATWTQALGRNWTAWDKAQGKESLSQQALQTGDVEHWMEACAQLGCYYAGAASVRSLAQVAVALHGIPFAMEVGLSLWDGMQGSWNAHRIANEYLPVLRQAIACADEASYAEALALAESRRGQSDAAGLACAYLFPHLGAWAEDCIRQNREDTHRLLKDCVVSVADAVKYFSGTECYMGMARPALCMHILLHGEAAFDLLVVFLRKAQGKTPTQQALEMLTRMRVPQMLAVLVEQIEDKEVRAALDTLAEEFPAAVLKLAIARALAGRSRTVEGWTVRLALRQPAALQLALAASDQADSARFQSLLAQLGREDAGEDGLPELLRNPPWLQPNPQQTLPTLDIPTQTRDSRIEWPDADKARFAQYQPNAWMAQRVPADVSVEAYVFGQLCIANAAHARLLAGGELRPEDIVKARHFYGTYPDYLFLLPPALALNLWNSVPESMWHNWGIIEPIKALLAVHGLAALPGFLAYAQAHPDSGLELAAQIDSPALASLALHALRNLKKAKPAALYWIKAHPATTAVVALPQAFGKDKAARDNAQFGVRWLASNGFAELVAQTAQDYGGPLPAATQALLDADPLRIFPSKLPKLPAFFVPAAFRRPELPDGGALPVAAVGHIGMMLAISTLESPYAGLAIVRQTCTPASLAEFAWDVFEAWQSAGAPSKEAWAFTALGFLGDDETARRLALKIRDWPGESAHARAVAGLDLLAAIGSDAALMHLNAIAGKVKFKALQDRAKEKITAVAEARGFTPEELADRLVPDLGLDEAGALMLDFGPRQFFVSFDETLKPYVKDRDGARLKDLPKPIKSDDAALAAAATERHKQIKKDAKAIASAQVARLERAMVAGRRWPAADFRLFFLHHPLLRHLAARLVWGVYADDGTMTEGFRIAEDWTLADADDNLYALDEAAQVGIAHVLDMPPAAQTVFGQLFADYEIMQPFKQLGRETYALSEAEHASAEITRFKDKTVATGSVLGLVNKGWERGDAQDSGWIGGYIKRLSPAMQAELELDPGTVVGDTTYEPKQKLPKLTLRKPGTWGPEGLIPFGELPKISASEVLRDIELMAAI